jgi:DMSO/TMAO reductase YedYZ molybdopterin-dependent catalytic subunit
MAGKIARRDLLRLGMAGSLLGGLGAKESRAEQEPEPLEHPRPYLTKPLGFTDVSRGNPNPKTLKGEALVKARLTPETWRLEIVADEKSEVEHQFSGDGAFDYAALLRLGETRAIRYFKALQCNLIAVPLGQGLWEGIALRDLLKLCGRMNDVRRVYYWGFHNDIPKQIFRSSMAINQVLDSPPGGLPPLVAYKLNGAPIPVERGGPVRMIVPWAHGFKSIKWLQHLVLTNRYDANDTYAEKNNDPESYLKTAAYFDSDKEVSVATGGLRVTGTAMVGWPGLDRVECWLRPNPNPAKELPSGDPAWDSARWMPAVLEPFPKHWKDQLPEGTLPRDIWGFDAQGRPKEWPLRFSLAYWRIDLKGLQPGKYELRVRSVDQNGFAQPEPRPNTQSGDNLIPCKLLSVTG